MKKRVLGKTGFEISEISLGTWQVGGRWGEPFDHHLADSILNTAIDEGVNFIDTADVYGDGESERAVGRLVQSRKEWIYIATKCGRQLSPHTDQAYKPEVLRKFVESSLRNMKIDTIDLIQLHCPPTETYERPEIFELFSVLKQEGKIRHFGVSVERIEEALRAIEYENVSTVQLIFNMFRQRPIHEFFEIANQKNIGIIARVPLASGLLSGTFTSGTQFGPEDHRSFNRNGQAFDKGETFSGIPWQKGLEAVEALKTIFPNSNLAAVALRWILMYNEVSCVIPGASRPEQVLENLKASALPELSAEQMEEINAIYNQYIWPDLQHEKW